jgi:uncharacterized protein YeaO (DUF488 family)
MHRRTSVQIAIEVYEDAMIRGLCHEGALEVAVGAMDGVNRKSLLRQLENYVKRSKGQPIIQIKRVHEPPSKDDGVRVLVDRLWPRGIAKEAAKVNEWFKDLAPSTPLRKWFGHDPARWEEFQRRYRDELNAQPDRIAALLDLAQESTLTLVYAAKDEQHNNAAALRNYLAGRT